MKFEMDHYSNNVLHTSSLYGAPPSPRLSDATAQLNCAADAGQRFDTSPVYRPGFYVEPSGRDAIDGASPADDITAGTQEVNDDDAAIEEFFHPLPSFFKLTVKIPTNLP